MPNRIIKESAFTSEKISNLSDFAFRLWVGLITQADDNGRGDARPAIIKGRVFALRERVSVKDIDNALHALAAGGCVTLYTVGGKPYYQFPHWADHQRVRNVLSKYPSPEDADTCMQATVTCGEVPQVAASCGELRPESNPIQSESNPNPNPYICDATASLRTRFKKPTIEEVRAYCFERGNNVDAQHWYDYYASNGWRVGKNPMKDWKAAVRTWERNGYDSKPGKQRKYITADDYASSPRPEIDMDELRRVIDKI